LVALSEPDLNNSRKLLQYKQGTAYPPFVALSEPDLNNSRKLLQYKQGTACPPFVALSTADLNNSRKVLQHKQFNTCPVNNTSKVTQKSSLCVDDYGDFFKKGLLFTPQPEGAYPNIPR